MRHKEIHIAKHANFHRRSPETVRVSLSLQKITSPEQRQTFEIDAEHSGKIGGHSTRRLANEAADAFEIENRNTRVVFGGGLSHLAGASRQPAER